MLGLSGGEACGLLKAAPANAGEAGAAAAPPGAKRAASQAFLASLRGDGGAGLDAAGGGGGKKAREKGSGPPRRSSVFRGVTRHRWTGRFEAHLWDAASERAPGSTRGRQKASHPLAALCSSTTST